MLVALLGLLTALVNAHMPVGRPPLLQAMRQALRMMLLGAPIMVLLFAPFPRMAPLWAIPTDKASLGAHRPVGQMSIGSMASLVQDGSVALRVRFDTPGGEPPQPRDLYFRGPVLTAFNGREWYALSQPEARPSSPPPRPPRPGCRCRARRSATNSRWSSPQRPWLLTLDVPRAAPRSCPRACKP